MTNASTSYQLVCGLEIHAELKTASKMFCGCKNDPFNAPEPNIYTCPVCLGMPGGLPVANKKAIEWTILLGLSLNCKINLFSKFDRKNYFYPDLPKGYQISQYDIPFCYDGYIDTNEGRIRIRRIHLEEDTGKLLHRQVDGEKVSLVDFNRSGVPLVEIVTEPDIITPNQAKEYGKKIRQQLRYLGIADCDMEQGGMRLEANISLREEGTTELPNYKVEVKNINSFRFLEQAVEFEMDRHQPMLIAGETPKQETRGWDATANKTFPQRTKEDAEDYRYFPDPDLPPIRFSEEDIESIKKTLSEPLQSIEVRWVHEAKLKPADVEVLLSNYDNPLQFDAIIAESVKQKVEPSKVISAIVNKKIALSSNADNSIQASTVVANFISATKTASISTHDLQKALQQIISDNPSEYQRYKAGETKLVNFFIGQVMRALKQKIDPAAITSILDQ